MRDFRATKKYRGEVAARYDEKRAVKDVTRRDQAIVENYLSKIAPGSSVLDIPAGTGRFIQFCLGRGLRYTGVDISADMLDVARTKVPAGATNIELRVADARALPFGDDAFDYAIIIKFIKWLPNLELLIDVLKEIKRVTRKEAFVQIKVTRRLPLRRRAADLLGRLPIARHVFGTLADKDSSSAAKTPVRPFRSFSQQELAEAFAAAGLHVRAIVPDGDLRRGRNFYVLAKQVD